MLQKCQRLTYQILTNENNIQIIKISSFALQQLLIKTNALKMHILTIFTIFMVIFTNHIYKNNIPSITYRHNFIIQKYFMFVVSRSDLSNKYILCWHLTH